MANGYVREVVSGELPALFSMLASSCVPIVVISGGSEQATPLAIFFWSGAFGEPDGLLTHLPPSLPHLAASTADFSFASRTPFF